MLRAEEDTGWQRTAVATAGWRRRGCPLTNSDLSRTGDDLRRDADAIFSLFFFSDKKQYLFEALFPPQNFLQFLHNFMLLRPVI